MAGNSGHVLTVDHDKDIISERYSAPSHIQEKREQTRARKPKNKKKNR